jgi:hypothetical protein
MEAKDDMINYLVLVSGNGVIKGYRLRDYQRDILKIAMEMSWGRIKYDKLTYDGQRVVVTIFSNGENIGFITEKGQTRYFVNYKNNVKISKIKQNDDNSWNIYDNEGNIITEW